MHFATVPAAFAAAVNAEPARPLLTWYDDPTGERTELSGATCANWVAKTANLLVDGCGLDTGDRAAVAAPPHWQTAAVLIGCWSAGLQVIDPVEPPAPAVVFATEQRAADQVGRADEVYGLALAPMAAAMSHVPPGVTDFVLAARVHGDEFVPVRAVQPGDLATRLTHQQLTGAATERAAALGIPPGGRVLIDVAAYPDPLDWLLAPLLAGASTVLCGRLDLAKLPDRVIAERVTTVLTGDAGS